MQIPETFFKSGTFCKERLTLGQMLSSCTKNKKRTLYFVNVEKHTRTHMFAYICAFVCVCVCIYVYMYVYILRKQKIEKYKYI